MTSRVRRPVATEEAPEDRAGRRGCLLAGAVSGIVAGALLAFFVVPPLMNYYFGTADIAAGKTYTAGGRSMRVTAAPLLPGADGGFEVALEVTITRPWTNVGPDAFTLELTSGQELAALAPDSARPETSFAFTLGEPRTLLLRFPAPARPGAQPLTLHVSGPRVRFHLQPDSRE